MRIPTRHMERPFPFLGRPALFVHTPKCGGSYVAAAIGRRRFARAPEQRHPRLRGHLTWIEYRDRLAEMGQDVRDRLTISLVRNPWDWHLSWFSYIRADTGGRRSGHVLEHTLFQRFSFHDYIDWLEDPDAPRGPQGYIVRQLSDWFVDESGRIAVDHVLRQEHLADDLRRLARAEGLCLKLPRRRRNASRTAGARDWRPFYSDHDAERIARRHARDIALFGYSFDPDPAR